MKRAVSVLALVAVIGATVPSAALAGSRGRSSGFRTGHAKSVFPQPVDPWKSWGVSPRHRHSFTPFVGTPGFFVGGTSVIVTQPPQTEIIDASPVVYASPLIAAPAPVAVPVSATLPMSTLVEYVNGWYQLRGDGVNTPYQWIWIPKPPAPPAPSAQGPDVAVRPVHAEARDRRGQAYHWTDDRGVTTWTNRLERVPKRFRDQAAARTRSD